MFIDDLRYFSFLFPGNLNPNYSSFSNMVTILFQEYKYILHTSHTICPDPFLFCSVPFCSFPFCSIPFCFTYIPFCSVSFYSVPILSVLVCCVMFCSIAFCCVPFCSTSFCSALLCSVLLRFVLLCSSLSRFTPFFLFSSVAFHPSSSF